MGDDLGYKNMGLYLYISSWTQHTSYIMSTLCIAAKGRIIKPILLKITTVLLSNLSDAEMEEAKKAIVDMEGEHEDVGIALRNANLSIAQRLSVLQDIEVSWRATIEADLCDRLRYKRQLEQVYLRDSLHKQEIKERRQKRKWEEWNRDNQQAATLNITGARWTKIKSEMLQQRSRLATQHGLQHGHQLWKEQAILTTAGQLLIKQVEREPVRIKREDEEDDMVSPVLQWRWSAEQLETM